jgi:hypothetical protein
MFVSDFVNVALPWPTAQDIVFDVLRDDGPRLATEAWHQDLDAWTSAGLDRTAIAPPELLQLEVGDPAVRDEVWATKLWWESPAQSRLLPALHADLELAPRGPEASDLHLLGTYDYLDDRPRSAAEHRLARRAATSAIRTFLTRVAEVSLREAARMPSTPASP